MTRPQTLGEMVADAIVNEPPIFDPQVSVDMALNSLHNGLSDLIGFAADEEKMAYLADNHIRLEMDLGRLRLLCSALRAINVDKSREAAE